MSKFRDEDGGDSYGNERHRSSTYGDKDRGGLSDRRRDRTPEKRDGRPTDRKTESRPSRKGKESESSPLDLIEGYMDNPSNHRRERRGTSEDGSKRHETAENQVLFDARKDDVSGDNKSAQRDIDQDGKFTRRDYTKGGYPYGDVAKKSSSEREGKPWEGRRR